MQFHTMGEMTAPYKAGVGGDSEYAVLARYFETKDRKQAPVLAVKLKLGLS